MVTKNKFLQVGDVFKVDKGFKVYAEIPEIYVYQNGTPNIKELTETELKVGDVLKSNAYDSITESVNRFIKDLKEKGLTVKRNRILNAIYTHNEISDIPETLDTSIFIGEYVVIEARLEGGDSNPRDPYPDGWHIIASQLQNGHYKSDAKRINFYQSGCFTIMHEKVEAIRKMKMIMTPVNFVSEVN